MISKGNKSFRKLRGFFWVVKFGEMNFITHSKFGKSVKLIESVSSGTVNSIRVFILMSQQDFSK